MSKLLKTVMILGAMAFAFAPSAHAQVMGICAGWVPDSSSYCTEATPSLDIGTTMNSNPTFNIAVNGGGTTSSTELLVLIPTSGGATDLSFSATFTLSNGGSTTLTATAFSTTPFTASFGGSNNAYLLSSYLGLTVTSGTDYHFNSINGVQSVSGTTGYTVYLLSVPYGLTSGSNYVSVNFSGFSSGSGFPVGTIFLALGDNGSGTIIYRTPLTMGLENTVPEPMSLTLFGTGLLGIALLVRRRMRKESEEEA